MAKAKLKLMLIDGNSLVYRAFHALPKEMSTANGQVTNAVYGFSTMLISLLKAHKPNRIAVAFDRPEPTFRHKALPTYKAQREAAPEILLQQLDIVKELLGLLGVSVVDLAGSEADDIIATLASEGEGAGAEVMIVTGDRDSYQLVKDPFVSVLYCKRGVSNYELYDEAGIVSKTGVLPSQYVEMAAMRGDASDNLVGVPGVGEKTAAKLINEHTTIDAIYEAQETFTQRLRENLVASEARVRQNVDLMTLQADLQLDVGIADLAIGDADTDALATLLDGLEFHSLEKRLSEAFGIELPAKPEAHQAHIVPEVNVVTSPSAAIEAIDELSKETDVIAMSASPGGFSSGIAFAANSSRNEVWFLGGALLGDEDVLARLRDFFANSETRFGAHDAKIILRQLLNHQIDARHLVFDTALAAYLLNPGEREYKLDTLLQRHAGLGVSLQSATSGQLDLMEGNLEGNSKETSEGNSGDNSGVNPEGRSEGSSENYLEGSSGNNSEGNGEEITRAASQALAVTKLIEPMSAALEALGLKELNDTLEVPLVRVLARMEHIGIAVNPNTLRQIRDELKIEAENASAEVIAEAGRDFNVNSPKQLGEVLFEDLGLTPVKKIKTGYSTGAQTLEKISNQHVIVGKIIHYREVEKLRSTYGAGLIGAIGHGNRIRASFNQTVARTGRLSSDAPNLHNIPMRTERGRVFRTAFVAAEGNKLLVADYDQIELRCIAHLSGDMGMIEAFRSGADIHKTTAAEIFGVDVANVTSEQRNRAKMVTYGLAYGMESYGLSQRLNISRSEAAEILDAFFGGFPAVKQYMDDTVHEARERGYTETLFGRRRQIPDLDSRNFQLRNAAERQAMNAGIQGLAADIFKVALIRLDKELEDNGLSSRIVLQVHDEIIVEAPNDEVEAAKNLTSSVMRGAFEMQVPMEVNLQVGSTWADAKG